MRDHVAAVAPVLFSPFQDASRIAVTGPDRGVIKVAGGFANHGEPACLVRDDDGRISEVWVAGTKLLSETEFSAELTGRYEKTGPDPD